MLIRRTRIEAGVLRTAVHHSHPSVQGGIPTSSYGVEGIQQNVQASIPHINLNCSNLAHKNGYTKLSGVQPQV